jgi:hypothetical protein
MLAWARAYIVFSANEQGPPLHVVGPVEVEVCDGEAADAPVRLLLEGVRNRDVRPLRVGDAALHGEALGNREQAEAEHPARYEGAAEYHRDQDRDRD